jgi:hypothetical protein
MQKTTNLVGQRVKVLNYGGSDDGLYTGREGLVSFSVTRGTREVYMVLLDEDPSPKLAEWLGGLPCYDYELEVINHA